MGVIIFYPGKSYRYSKSIGAVIMAFDDVRPILANMICQKFMKMTHRWLDRCIDQMNNCKGKYGYNQALFPIVQEAHLKIYERNQPNIAKNAIGNAIGGLSVGEPEEDLYEMTALVTDILPKSNQDI